MRNTTRLLSSTFWQTGRLPHIFPLFLSLWFALLSSVNSLGIEPTQETTPPDGKAIMLAFLKEKARELDSKFLQGVDGREQWEAGRKELREQYLEMLGLWPMPERTPLEAQVTRRLEGDEEFQ